MSDLRHIYDDGYRRLPRGRELKPIEYAVNENDCHIVTSHKKDKDGYIRLCRRIEGKKRMVYLHRVVYEQQVGKIPNGEIVRHACDNPSCINPEHLLSGTTLDNMRDKVARDRSSYGSRNGRAKLTEKDVIDIRNDRRDALSISKEYGITRSNVYDIRNHKTWKHIS